MAKDDTATVKNTKEATIRVEMTECVAGIHFLHRPGRRYDLPAHTARQYIAADLAMHVDDTPASLPQK